MSLLSDLNSRYLELHVAKEEAFWAEKMGLEGFEKANFEEKEVALKEFGASPENLRRVRQELERNDLPDQERVGLKGWERYFSVNQIEGEEAKNAFRRLVEMEGELGRRRMKMELGYDIPATGEFRRASSVELALKIRSSDDEALRKAAFNGLRSVEPFVLENGFLDVVRQRNQLARMLGYVDYYDWKVTINEGFGKEKLFAILDDLEEKTREACSDTVADIIEEHGEKAIEPWNFSYYTSGNLTAEIDPYYPFARSFDRWGRSFAALGIKYSGATLTLDLVDREGKYSNGFMHGPSPAWLEDERFHSARINFTANAVPGQVGSGHRATQTFFHEGGHAAHFANIRMPAPCFSQEFAPTSVAFAETQSMFLDSLLDDADWLRRYAHTADGEQMPVDVIRRVAEERHTLRAWRLRSMLSVPYAEKALYEMSDEELTPENVLRTFRKIETDLQMIPSAPRPLLSIPHLLSGESSAYYHGYVLAEMAVYQTRDYFIRTYGHIVDNPHVGPRLREAYWEPGNSKTFLEFVEDLTGEPFSARATIELVNRSLDDVQSEVEALLENEEQIPRFASDVDLDATIAIVHGNETIASTAEGLSFDEVSDRFAEWIDKLESVAQG